MSSQKGKPPIKYFMNCHEEEKNHGLNTVEETELLKLIEHFEQQIELANDYIELNKMFKDIDILQFICINKKVIDKLKNH